MARSVRLSLAVAAVAALAATSAVAQSAPPSLIVTTGPVANGSMNAVGYAPDFDAGCATDAFTSVLVIETATRSALGTVTGLCGIQTTMVPAGSCKSNAPHRPGFTCAHTAGGITRVAYTQSSDPIRGFGFAEIGARTWFQVAGTGAGAG